jgi:hypothetical protein
MKHPESALIKGFPDFFVLLPQGQLLEENYGTTAFLGFDML